MPQHIFNEYAVPPSRIIHQHMGHCTNDFAVLDDGATAQSRVK